MTTHDLEDDALHYVAEALKITGRNWVDMDTLVDAYELPRPNNVAEIRAHVRSSLEVQSTITMSSAGSSAMPSKPSTTRTNTTANPPSSAATMRNSSGWPRVSTLRP